MEKFVIKRPMLANACEDFGTIRWPVLASPKLDGLRCLIVEGRAVSRKLLPIPNHHTRQLLEDHFPEGFDGELMVVAERNDSGGAASYGTFNQAQSAVMTEDGIPDVQFLVFDVASALPYEERMAVLRGWECPEPVRRHFRALLPVTLDNLEELEAYETRCLKAGYEGVMIRDPQGPYKMGRSTAREGYLQKVKRFDTFEAKVVSFIERLHNANEAQINELGLTKRSSHKANMQPMNTLGALVLRLPDGREFQCGTGFTDAQRQEIWDNRDKCLGKFARVKSQPHGAKDLPRFPVWQGWRDPKDMS